MKIQQAALPITGLVSGVVLGMAAFNYFHWSVPAQFAIYLSIAALAALDTVCGGIRAGIEGRFQNDIFVSGFVLNTLLAAALVWFFDHLGINLALVAVLVLGSRVFNNLSLIRRFYLNNIALNRKKQQEENLAQTVIPSASLSQKSEIGGGL